MPRPIQFAQIRTQDKKQQPLKRLKKSNAKNLEANFSRIASVYQLNSLYDGSIELQDAPRAEYGPAVPQPVVSSRPESGGLKSSRK